MMTELIDRRRVKAETRTLLRTAQVRPMAFTALYLGLTVLLSLVDLVASLFSGGKNNLLTFFVSILMSLASIVLEMGFILYCMEIRRGQRSEFLTLFDGFSFVGKIIALQIFVFAFVFFWCLLLIVPGIIAAYRYRFAFFNLCEDPSLSPMQALNLSKRQTMGYKGQLFMLDLSFIGWSLLGSLPAMIYSGSVSYQIMMNPFAEPTGFFVSPLFLIIALLWSLVVSLFYLPLLRCSELSYFEVAKRTSGTGADAAPHAPTSPDGLGGL